LIGDFGNAIAVDEDEHAYIAGATYSSNFPVTAGAFQSTNKAFANGGSNGFVSKLDLSPAATALHATMTLKASANPTLPGSSVTFTSAVSATVGKAIPSGMVAFEVDGATVAKVALSSGGVAAYTAPKLEAGSHTVVAVYGGNALFAPTDRAITEAVQLPVTPAPVISPAAGVYKAVQTVKISDSVTAGTVIYYTTDGTTPTTASRKYGAAGIQVSAAETVKAVAMAAGRSPSSVAAASYVIRLPLDKPVLSVKPGTYSDAQSVTVTDASPAAVLYYTLGGGTPTASSKRYTGPISIGKSEILKVIALATGYPDSPIVSATYTIR
jgi:hypothetical protein